MVETEKKTFLDHLDFKTLNPIFATFTYAIALLIAVCFAYRTFRPQKIRFPKSIEITVVDAKGNAKDFSAEGKAHVKEQLHTALMEVSGKAEAAYNEKFAALLTVLSIFGIAWPLILGLLQFRFNEREINKIDESADKINGIEQTANKAEELAKNAEDKIKDVEQKVEEANKQAQYAAQVAEDSSSSVVETQIIMNELKEIKNNIYSDYPFVYQALASYFYNMMIVPAIGKKDQKEYLTYSAYALEMGMKGLYYACLSNNTTAITDMQKRVLRHFEILDEYMNTNNVTEKQPIIHFNSSDWKIIEKKIDTIIFEKMKKIYDNRFYEKGAQ